MSTLVPLAPGWIVVSFTEKREPGEEGSQEFSFRSITDPTVCCSLPSEERLTGNHVP